jgi:hypothetical protein
VTPEEALQLVDAYSSALVPRGEDAIILVGLEAAATGLEERSADELRSALGAAIGVIHRLEMALVQSKPRPDPLDASTAGKLHTMMHRAIFDDLLAELRRL